MPSQAEILRELGVSDVPGGAQLAGGVPNINANDLGNDPTMEGMWAMKAMEHAEIHFNILCVVDPKSLKLTQKDQMLYDAFREEFPNFNVECLDENALKSKEAKEKWRPFMNNLKTEVEDFSFATLVRIKASGEYNEENTILVTRIQFLCIEIARNREGFNDNIRHEFKPKPRSKAT
ncbi:protein PBDC1 isoform X2 [Hyalella azteca]|uniref:Protein PBDC1 isoform X2 n=1 Tax=Hyalella azteca TaxID=294128 RepID=A0A8B7N9N7_HYAAZ|nr:protein PBDC1 isoform X2 [Hyalella azteca]